MRNHISSPLKKTLVLLACFATGAFALDSLTLKNAGANAVMGGVYTSPYGISINGSSTSVLMICDDYTTDININDTWSANATSLTQINQSSVAGLKFATAPYNSSPGIQGGPTKVSQDYATAVVLAAQLMSLPNIGTSSENAEVAGELSYAIWGVFDAPLLTSVNTGYGTLTATELAAANSYLVAAQSLVAGATTGGTVDLTKISIGGHSINGATIYTSTPLDKSQEFILVSMPEPAYPAVLALDLLAVVGLIVVFRRRLNGIFS